MKARAELPSRVRTGLPARRRVSARARAWLALAAAVLLTLVVGGLSAQPAEVPAKMQAELFAKLASYDRNFTRRAGATAHILLVVRADDTESSAFATSMKAALGRVERIAGLPHRESIVVYEGAVALAKLCRSDKIAAVYFAPGLGSEVERVRNALAGIDVLTVGARAEYVPSGLVLGFDLVSGKPKILLNLPQAKQQSVDFKSDVVKLMKVYR